MAAYLIANVRVHAPEQYREYVARVPALIAKHGGEYRVRGGDVVVLEGQWPPSRLIVMEFPNREAALNFYNDPEYTALKAIRLAVADSEVVLADCLDGTNPVAGQ